MAGALTDLVERTGAVARAVRDGARRARAACRARPGAPMLAHFGLGVTLLGIVCATHLGHRADRRDEAGRRASRCAPTI